VQRKKSLLPDHSIGEERVAAVKGPEAIFFRESGIEYWFRRTLSQSLVHRL
jgi:hypothetical protein